MCGSTSWKSTNGDLGMPEMTSLEELDFGKHEM
jgi:hypothetical protein